MTAKDPEFALEYFKQIETLAADILSDRRDIIEYNKKRDKVREASRAIKTKAHGSGQQKTSICCGNMFISSFNDEQLLEILDKDFKNFMEKIDKLHDGLKAKVNKLYEAENRAELKGYNLNSFTREERESLNI